MSNTPYENMVSHNSFSESPTIFVEVDDQISSHTGRQQTNHKAKKPKSRGRPAMFQNQIGNQVY